MNIFYATDAKKIVNRVKQQLQLIDPAEEWINKEQIFEQIKAMAEEGHSHCVIQCPKIYYVDVYIILRTAGYQVTSLYDALSCKNDPDNYYMDIYW